MPVTTPVVQEFFEQYAKSRSVMLKTVRPSREQFSYRSPAEETTI